jgi:hypothetical protein
MLELNKEPYQNLQGNEAFKNAIVEHAVDKSPSLVCIKNCSGNALSNLSP